MRRFPDRRLRIHPAPRILRLQHDGPAVMNVHHAAARAFGDDDEPDFYALRYARPEVGDPRHENGLAVLAADIPRLLPAMLERPLEPASPGNDDPPLAEHMAEVASRQRFFHSGIDPGPLLFFHLLRRAVAPGGVIGMKRPMQPV